MLIYVNIEKKNKIIFFNLFKKKTILSVCLTDRQTYKHIKSMVRNLTIGKRNFKKSNSNKIGGHFLSYYGNSSKNRSLK